MSKILIDEATVKLALEALEQARGALAYVAVGNAETNPNLARARCSHGIYAIDKVEPALREALAEQPAQQEPVKHELQCICGCSWEIDADGNEELVSSPPAQRTWVGLSEEDREQHRNDWYSNIHDKEFRAIEAKLRSKNEDRN